MAEQVTKDTRVTNSKEQWAGFDAWGERKGHQSRAESFRAAMDIVINSDDACQDNSEKKSTENENGRDGAQKDSVPA